MTELTEDGKRLAEALVRAGAVSEYRLTNNYWIEPFNAAAASLRLPIEGDASLREAVEPFAKAWDGVEAISEQGAGYVHDGSDAWVSGNSSGGSYPLFKFGDLRRAHAALARPQPEAKGPVAAGVIGEIAAERRRQIDAEGWTPEHDDEHAKGEMAAAAANYTALAAMGSWLGGEAWAEDVGPPLTGLGYSAGWEHRLQNAINWPWDRNSWKSGSVRKMLVKSGALIVAEIERLDRASGASTTPPAEAKTPDAGVGECCIPGAGEPSFVLLGRDPQAPDIVEAWASERELLEPESDKPIRARKIAADMRLFKALNPAIGPAKRYTPTGSVGEDDTGVREALVKADLQIGDGHIEAARRTLHAAMDALATQPPKAETPAGVGEPNVTVSGPYHYKHDQHPCFRVDGPGGYVGSVAIHDDDEDAAYSLAEALAAAVPGNTSTAPAARPGDEVERADAAMKAIWAAWIKFYNAHFRAVTGISAADQMAFYEIAQPILRALAAAPAADGGRG